MGQPREQAGRMAQKAGSWGQKMRMGQAGHQARTRLTWSEPGVQVSLSEAAFETRVSAMGRPWDGTIPLAAQRLPARKEGPPSRQGGTT